MSRPRLWPLWLIVSRCKLGRENQSSLAAVAKDPTAGTMDVVDPLGLGLQK